MKCFGGPGVKKKACRNRKCTVSDSACTTSSPKTKVTNLISKLSTIVQRTGIKDVII